jgi:ribosomal protein S18 acetylase RimI-like enzyme
VPPAIAPASAEDLDDVLPLFAGYQRFYTGTARDDTHNRAFLERFLGDDGQLLVARDGSGAAVGFANLYWTFSSTTAEEHVLLNDLFVSDDVRGGGVGRALIDAAAAVARERGSTTLSWQTALDNRAAQRLYERVGAERSAWFEYELDVQPTPNAGG